MAILWIIQKYRDSMEILLLNSMDKKKVGFGFDLKKWVGFEKHPYSYEKNNCWTKQISVGHDSNLIE